MLTRPSVKTRPAVDRHHGERVVEFCFPNGKGGLISLHTSHSGTPIVEFCRVDAGVEILVDQQTRHADNDLLTALEDILESYQDLCYRSRLESNKFDVVRSAKAAIAACKSPPMTEAMRTTVTYYRDYPRPEKDQCDIEIVVDFELIARMLGPKAAKSKGGKSQIGTGMIKVKRLSKPTPAQ